MKKHFLLTPVLLAGALAIASPAHAAQLAFYDFNPAAPGITVPASSDTDTGTTASDTTFGAGYVTGTTAGYSTTFGNGDLSSAYARIPNTPTTSLAAKNGNYYLQFGVTATTGKTFSLTNLTFDTDTTSTTALTGNYEVRSSIDNYGSVLGGQFNQNNTGVTGPGTWATTLSSPVNFSGPSYNYLNSATFRIYFYESNAAAGSSNALRVDNIRLNGTVATPEPSTWAMMGLGLGAILFVARRRKRESGGTVSFAGATA
jgi:hypothetical protein